MKNLGLVFCVLLAAMSGFAGCGDDDGDDIPTDARRDTTGDAPVTDARLDGALDAGIPDTGDAAADAPPADAALVDVPVGDVADVITGEGGLTEAGAGEEAFVASLTGASENPPVTTTATGTMDLILNAARTELRYRLRHNVANATAGHFHVGAPGVNGPIEIAFPSVAPDTTVTVPITAAQVALLEAGNLYANVHSTANPNGEIRGQVLRPGEALYISRMTGANEVPPVTTAATGFVSFLLNPARTSVTYQGSMSGLVPTMAHIHVGAVGMNGAIIYPLTFTATTLGGTQAVTAADITAFDNLGYYTNVHTAANPGGEIRGQITKL